MPTSSSQSIQSIADGKSTAARSDWSRRLSNILQSLQAQIPQTPNAIGQIIFGITAAERAAGVTPVNYAIPSHTAVGYVIAERYGAVADGATNNATAFANASLVAGQLDLPIGLLGTSTSVYVTQSQLVLSGTGQAFGGKGPPVGGAGATGARLIGLCGRPTIKFTTLGSSTDCVALGGSNVPQIEIRNVQLNCNNVGQDGLTILGANMAVFDNVVVLNAARDSLVLEPSNSNWIEKARFAIQLYNSGRHAVRMQLSGTGSYLAYINECLWEMLEVRTVSVNTAGGAAVYMTASGTPGVGAGFFDHTFVHTVFDSGYTGSGNAPSVSPVYIDSGAAKNFSFLGGGWESTGGASPGAGYSCHVTGTGTWTGLFMAGISSNSFWGAGVGGVNPDPAIANMWNFDYSFAKSYMTGPLLLALASAGQTVAALSGNATGTPIDDFLITRTGAANSSNQQDACLALFNSTSNTKAYIQQYNGQLIVRTLVGGVVAECHRAIQSNSIGGVQISSAAAIYTGSGAPSASTGANGDLWINQAGGSGTTIYQKRAGSWVGIV